MEVVDQDLDLDRDGKRIFPPQMVDLLRSFPLLKGVKIDVQNKAMMAVEGLSRNEAAEGPNEEAVEHVAKGK